MPHARLDLARNEGINQAGLADLLEITADDAGAADRPHGGSRLDRAASRIRPTGAPGWLYLTAKARPILGRIRDVANDTRDEALARLSPTE